MANPFWLWENWLVERLLRSPSWHRFVGTIHTRMRHLREGKRPDEMGGMSVDDPNKSVAPLLKHFKDEIKSQFKDLSGGRGPPKA